VAVLELVVDSNLSAALSFFNNIEER